MSCLGSGLRASVPTGMLRALLTVGVTLAPGKAAALAGLGALVDLDLDVAHLAQVGAAEAEVAAGGLEALPLHVARQRRAGWGRPRPTTSWRCRRCPRCARAGSPRWRRPATWRRARPGACQMGSRTAKPLSASPPRGSRLSTTAPSAEARSTLAPCAPCPTAASSVSRRRRRPRRRPAARGCRRRPRRPRADARRRGVSAKPPLASASTRASAGASAPACTLTDAPGGAAPGRVNPRGTASWM